MEIKKLFCDIQIFWKGSVQGSVLVQICWHVQERSVLDVQYSIVKCQYMLLIQNFYVY